MRLGHPMPVPRQYREFGPLSLNSTTNASLVALSDGATSVASCSRENSRKSQDI